MVELILNQCTSIIIILGGFCSPRASYFSESIFMGYSLRNDQIVECGKKHYEKNIFLFDIGFDLITINMFEMISIWI